MRFNCRMIIVVLLTSVMSYAVSPEAPVSEKITFKTGRVCVGVKCFNVDVADKPMLRSLGLMGRKELPANQGMWFVFDYLGKYTFWMKNTLVPLDIIFINERFEIVTIYENAQPCKEDPCDLFIAKANSQYVLEIPGGSVSAYNISVGDIAVYTQLSEIEL